MENELGHLRWDSSIWLPGPRHRPIINVALFVTPTGASLNSKIILPRNKGEEIFLLLGATAPSGPEPPYYRGFTITLRNTTLTGTPLDEWSARRKDPDLTTHNTHNKKTFMTGGIRTRNPSKRAAADTRLRRRGHWNRRGKDVQYYFRYRNKFKGASCVYFTAFDIYLLQIWIYCCGLKLFLSRHNTLRNTMAQKMRTLQANLTQDTKRSLKANGCNSVRGFSSLPLVFNF